MDRQCVGEFRLVTFNPVDPRVTYDGSVMAL